MKRIVKVRHKFINKLVKPIITKIIRKKFNYTHESYDFKPPFLVIGNHTTDWDAFFISKAFNHPIYFVMSDHVSSLKVGKVIKYFVAPIPITKSSIDAGTVRDIMTVIKQKGIVGIFPEGNKSFGGDMSYIKPSTAKLAKKLQVPLVLFNIEGGYFASPRWSKLKRLGHVHGYIKRVVSVEEMNNMTNEELYQIIKENLRVNAYEVQEKNKVKFVMPNDRAVGIESFLYICPKCKQISSLYGKDNDILCKNCDFSAHLDEYGYLSGIETDRLDVLDKIQKEYIRSVKFESYDKDTIITQDDGWEVHKKIDKFNNEILGIYSTLLKKDCIILKNENDEIKINLDEISGQAIEGACGIQLWLKNNDVYRIKNDTGQLSGLKYVNLISRLKNEEFHF